MNFIRTSRNLRTKCNHVALRFMASLSQRGDHVTITATQQRQQVISKATVMDVHIVSPSVRHLRLKVHSVDFAFKPGQWVDFFLPNSDTLSGYSICSTPAQLKAEGTIELAVKISDHPVATWVHEQCVQGSEVRVQAGGDFFYDPDVAAGELERDVLLLAGGVGINPLVSMFGHLADLQLNNANRTELGGVHLLYSARSDDELLFKNRISSICSANPNMRADFFVTTETQSADGIKQVSGRMNATVVDEALSTFRSRSRLSFVCGPPQMLADMEALLNAAGFRTDEIRYEKWW